MAYMLANFEVGDYDAWKQGFDEDPAGRNDSAQAHMIFRAVDNPNAVFVGVEFDSVDEARAFRQRLLDSGAMERAEKMITPPTVVEVADRAQY
ncbi:MAG TPA: hypothetical protein VKG89_04485 [Solirubrobacterales bacterium]|nr:hypothetical protein [Solirubrobacterales bacterium]